jgi:branched-chain amino acid transport system permease protein
MKAGLPRFALAGIAAAALLALPQLLSAYYLNLATQALFYAVFAMSLDLLVGYTGLSSLGHAVYFGAAAYAIALLSARGITGLFVAGGIALVVATSFAAAFGLLAIRGSALSFLMITLALGQLLWGLAFRWASVTGGDNGITGIARPRVFGLSLQSGEALYYFTLIVLAAAAALMALVVRSPFGLVLVGIREQPERMRALGFHVTAYQYAAFVIAGFFAGVSGILYAYFNSFVHPSMLSLTTSAEALLMVIAGGAGTLGGPVAGAILVVVLKNVASAYLERWLVLMGGIFVIIVLFAPGGLAAAWQALMARRRVAGGAPPDAGDEEETASTAWVKAAARPAD